MFAVLFLPLALVAQNSRTAANVIDTHAFSPSASNATDRATVNVATDCDSISDFPYYEDFELGFGCWTTVNGSAEGVPWSLNDCSVYTPNPHSGGQVAASYTWNGEPFHANAWLISPRFVLPNTTDSLAFYWWECTNHNHPGSYSVVLSTTTDDTAAFTTVVYPYSTATSTWLLKTVDLSPYAGQSVYLAFHHVDYDQDYILIDDIAVCVGGYEPQPIDTLNITFAVNDPAMGTTDPAPGTYQYLRYDTVFFSATPYDGYHFMGWAWECSIEQDTIGPEFIIAYMRVIDALEYDDATLTALFEADNPDSTNVENYMENRVVLFPNPANEYVDIRIDGGLNVTMMEVYDVYGKLVTVVETGRAPSLQTRINVSGLADGLYFVRVSTDRGVVTKQFVKR